MYRFMTETFGACNVRRKKQRGSGAAMLEIVEIETFHRFSSIVSSYRCEEKYPLPGNATQQSEVSLCRIAVAQFLQRNEAVHIARVEILDTTLLKFRGKLTSIPEHNNRSRERYSDDCLRFNPGSPL
jgi:hypothetical protein